MKRGVEEREAGTGGVMGEDNQPKRLLRMSRNFLIYIQVQIYKSVEMERDKPLPRHHRLPNKKSSARNGVLL